MCVNFQLCKLQTVIVVAAFLALTTGCGQFKARNGFLGTGIANDFEKTEILVGEPVQANGSEQLLIAIHLKNSDLSTVSNYLPEFEVIDGLGVATSSCTKSDANGVSACLVKAVIAGTKKLRLTNGKVGLEKEFAFKAPAGIQRLEILPAAGTTLTTASGSQIQLSFGQTAKGVNYVTNGGYKVRLSVQGVNH